MSNTYGFDFLKSEHLDGSNDPSAAPSIPQQHPTSPPSFATEADFAAAQNKPDLEKQFDILAFLQAHRGSGCLAPSVIYKATGIDLDVDTRVAEMLQRNPKVRVEMVPDPENPALMLATYAYQAKYASVRDRTTLLAQINRMVSGVSMRDLLDSYAGVEQDLQSLITAGDVVAIANTEDKDKILFPRGEAFLVELDGIVTIPIPNKNGVMNGNHYPVSNGKPIANGGGASSMPPPLPLPPTHCVVETDIDPQKQIRRGEAVQIGGQWFRVSSAVKEGVPLSDQPSRAQAPLSVVSLSDLSKRNEVDGYVRPFTGKQLPVDAPLTQTAQKNVLAAKTARERLSKLAHGRSGAVAAQLLGSHAHSSNPTTLASSFAGNAMSSIRKRPAARISAAGHQSQQQTLPKDALEKAAADPALALYSHARRHGCTKDVREMYLETQSLVPESDADLQKLLVEHKLLEPDEQMRRPRLAKSANVDNDGKPKKRRYYERKNQRMTNVHLEGTEIGALLARAAEKQRQGKSVGDGGM